MAHLRYPPEAVLAAGGVLTWDKAKEGSELPAGRNRLGSVTEAASAVAVMMPMPGMVARRRLGALAAEFDLTCQHRRQLAWRNRADVMTPQTAW
jgi:hypothetical protein